MSKTAYPIVIYELSEADGGGFAAFAPDLYGCMADGSTQQDALASIQTAIAEWIDEAKRLGREIPKPGSRARAAREEREALISFLKDNTGKLDELKAQIADLEGRMDLLAGSRDSEAEQCGWVSVLAALEQKRSAADKVH